MATEVKLPDEAQGVENITVNRWLVKAGDTVKNGDPLLEVATEKVDTQIQSPADGVVLQINFGEGDLVPANAILALIGAADEAKVAVPARAPEEPEHTEVKDAKVTPLPAEGSEKPQSNGQGPAPAAEGEPKVTPVARRVAEQEGIPLNDVKGSGPGGQVTKEDVLHYADQHKQAGEEPLAVAAVQDEELADIVSLPVGRLAAEHSIDLRQLAGDRPLRSLTVEDVLSAVESRRSGKPVTVQPRRSAQPAPVQQAGPAPTRQSPAPAQTPAAPPAPPAAVPRQPQGAPATHPELQPGEEFIPHTRMRSLIARNTVQAAFSIPHVTTWWDVSMSAVLEHRRAHKSEFATGGVNLTVTAYLVQGVITALKAVPAANSTWTDEGVIIKRYYNIGIAVALPADPKSGLGGLIVPVIKNADNLSLVGVARAVNDLAQRARANNLKADELQGGTFTITNYGTSGSRFQTPVIAGNEAGILGVGVIEKRPVVVSNGHPLDPNVGDSLAFLPMLTLGFSYDHRILDGATADAFCAKVKEALEGWK
jgi:pyruvate/2-oxoglutarate dehydrogenase complex dihydrolipoamide acyltransferase (E2) component